MRSINNIITGFFLVSAVILISFGCAQQGGGALVGGPKDTTPPYVVMGFPLNYSTNFTGQDFEFLFDEYFAIKDINNKLIISPPMEEKPEIKIKGKTLQIHFPKELQPDLTYTLNFGDALADLNENNAFENFAVVFSTGDAIDSLEMQGTVVDAFTGEPVESVSVMLYSTAKSQDTIANSQELRAKSQDSLPLTSLPLYVSRTDKEGKYHLKNLAGGEYKLFALLDGNNNYLYDGATEQIAFIDSLVAGVYIAPPAPPMPMSQDTIANSQDSIAKSQEKDSTALVLKDTTAYVMDSISKMEVDSINPQPETRNPKPETHNPKPAPRNLQPLRLFLEAKPKQQIRGTERKQADKVLWIFNEPLDTVRIDLLYADGIDDGLMYELSVANDSLTCWVTDSVLSMRDSLVFATGYMGYDSLEQREWMTDTLRFKFKPVPPKPGDQNPMNIRANTGRTMDLGVPFTLSTGLPYESIDTSKISLFMLSDSLEFEEEFKIIEVEQKGSLAGVHQDKLTKKQAIIDKVFLQDSSYSLRILPGAFPSWLGNTNDSLTVDFKMNTIEKYGTLIMKIDSLNEPAVLQLLNNKDVPIVERIISGDSVEKFELLKPSKYKFKLILDKNGNGKWDSGRYLKKIQPEEILIFPKEITLKANWEMEEVWEIL